jgi:CubicO group peptidase (beta-lactamase class C family)
MSKVFSRRELLSSGVKMGLGLVVLKDLGFSPRSVIARSNNRSNYSDHLRSAFERLDRFIAQHMNEIGAPGMTVSIVDRQGVLRTSQYGFADLKAGLKVNPQTLFEIGSISKSLVSIATVQLAEEGKLDLHRPVTDYLPWLKIESSYAPFGTHHLLSHTSGLSSVPLLTRVAVTPLRVGFEPGSRFAYSNLGYVLLGFLLESIDKRPFQEVLRKRLLEPLGMAESDPIITNLTRERLAVGYAPFYDDRPFPLHGRLGEAPWLEVPEAPGSVAATAGDMGHYMRMLLNRGAASKGRILSEKGFELLTKPVIKAPFRGEEASYAYGLWTSETKGHTLLRHTGGMVAFSSAMYIDLTDGFAVFASVNARLGSYRPVAVTRYALDVLSAASKDQELPALPAPSTAPDKILNARDYAGTFTAPEGKKLVLSANGERLVLLHNDERVVLEQAGPDRFIVKHPDFDLFLLTFGREQDAVVEAFHGSNWWTNERYSGAKSFEYPREWEAYAGHYRSDSPWYGSARIVIRKGRLVVDGEEPLAPAEPGVFRPEGDGAERITFDTIVNGRAMHLNYSGIDFYRTLTP